MEKGTIKIATVVGARPQFVKAATVSRAISRHNRQAEGQPRLEETIIHTGQHYDSSLSAVFFDELDIPSPGYHLEVGSCPHGRQTAAMLERIERILHEDRPDWVLLYGDTNSTLAGALAAAKLQIPMAHVEAGVRSFNRRMPEEINRILTDRVSSLLLCPTQAAVRNLSREGISEGVHRVGDVMYDSVLHYAAKAIQQNHILDDLGFDVKSYSLATVHRAENTDGPDRLRAIFAGLGSIDMPVILPLHPRTLKILQAEKLQLAPNIRVIEPVSYLDMLTLERQARAIFTDSGGMQKEAYFLGVPCITLRDETEWVELVEIGANYLAGANVERIGVGAAWAMTWQIPSEANSLYGGGNSAETIVQLLTGRQDLALRAGVRCGLG